MLLGLFLPFATCLLASGGCSREDDFLIGSDISALTVFEKHGAVYKNAEGHKGDGLKILQDAGQNCFRLRLFVNPDHKTIVTNDLEYTLDLAKRVKRSGAALFLNLHYSDTWADPAKQFIPADWKNLPLEALAKQVHDYTFMVFTRFIKEDVAPEYVQLGNEITNGMLWPIGKIEFAEKENSEAWDRFATLQLAAYQGLTEAYDDRPLPVRILHIECTGNIPRTRWYLAEAEAHGLPYDVLGLSYYPEWHGTLDDLKATLETAVTISGKPVMVVETAYPWKQDDHWNDKNDLDYPLTPEGQKIFLSDVTLAVRGLKDNLGRGVFWWHPESVLVPDMPVWLGGSCALFDDQGKILPAASDLSE